MTKIEWTDETWNPVTGCTKVSQGCKNCYAETIAKRFWGDRKFTDVQCHPERLDIPLRWKKPRMIFVNSMSDLFHPDVPKCFIDQVLEIIAATPQHTYQVLTKRPELMMDKLYGYDSDCPARELGGGDYLPNLWLGVSVEDQKTTNERIPWLLKTPAAVRFVSYEPALGHVDFTGALGFSYQEIYIEDDVPYEMRVIVPPVNWVIVGCESGQSARHADIEWFRSVRDQCTAAGVPFFLKQMMIDGKLVKTPELDGRVWAEYPEVTK